MSGDTVAEGEGITGVPVVVVEAVGVGVTDTDGVGESVGVVIEDCATTGTHVVKNIIKSAQQNLRDCTVVPFISYLYPLLRN
jgi:hypothetical protein